MGFRPLILFAAAALFLSAVAGTYLLAETQVPDSVVVTRTESGFEPSAVLIKKGGTVTFRNASEKPFWPASDFHPDHTAYPEFDPKRALLPGEEWTFTFEQPGTWRYHDHLIHEVRGKVHVAGSEEKDIESCLSRTAESLVRPECWEAEIVKKIETEGLDEAFELVKKLHAESPEFRDTCHYVMHGFGNAAYVHFKKTGETVEGPEASWCNWGFYHGFMETMHADRGEGNYEDLLAYCRKVRETGRFSSPDMTQSAWDECVHTIGYGIFADTAKKYLGDGEVMARKGIETCEGLLEGRRERLWCVTGLFIDLATAYGNQFSLLPAPIWGLSAVVSEPAVWCSKLDPLYHSICYRHLPQVHIREKEMGFEEALSYIRSFENPVAIFWGLAGVMHDETARPRWEIDLSAWPRICESIEGDTEQGACVSGIITGLTSRAEPEREHEVMGNFCTAIGDGALRGLCFNRMFERIRTLYAPEKISALCNTYLPERNGDCSFPYVDGPSWKK